MRGEAANELCGLAVSRTGQVAHKILKSLIAQVHSVFAEMSDRDIHLTPQLWLPASHVTKQMGWDLIWDDGLWWEIASLPSLGTGVHKSKGGCPVLDLYPGPEPCLNSLKLKLVALHRNWSNQALENMLLGASGDSGHVPAFIFFFLKVELGYHKPMVLLSFLACFLHFGADGGHPKLLWDWHVCYKQIVWLFLLINSLS